MRQVGSVAVHGGSSGMRRCFGFMTHNAQSILEYTVILAAIIAAIILGARVIGQRVENNFTAAGDVIDATTAQFQSLGPTP